MKIGEKRTREKFIKREKPGRRQVQVIHGPFLTTLQEKQAVEIDLDSALEVIDELGRKLRSQPTLANLKDYKAAVRSFLKQAIGGTYEVSERRFIDRLGRRRLYVIVAKVDERLDELTRLVLDRQDSTLDLASKLDEIRGLLLISSPKAGETDASRRSHRAASGGPDTAARRCRRHGGARLSLPRGSGCRQENNGHELRPSDPLPKQDRLRQLP